jgi:hypothetical protein
VHEGGWTITVGVDGAFLFHSPTGKPLAAVPPREHVGDILAWPREWAEANDLDIGPDTNYPQWDGTKPDYDLAVSGLLTAG